MFRKFVLSFAFLAATAMPLANSAEAAISDGVVAGHVQMQLPIEDAAFVYGGYSYCWYDDGWKGPGWYRCGYALRSGLGWGGAVGWNGWRGGAVVRGGVRVVHHGAVVRGGARVVHHGAVVRGGARVGHHVGGVRRR